MLYRKVAGLEFEVSHYALEPLKLATRAGWTRHTTVVHLAGKGVEGRLTMLQVLEVIGRDEHRLRRRLRRPAAARW